LDTLASPQAQKAAWVIKLVEDLEVVPGQYFQKMANTEDLWGSPSQVRGKHLPVFGILRRGKAGRAVPCVSEKDPEDASASHTARRGTKTRLLQEEDEMSDLQRYIRERKARDPEFAKGFDSGYEQFKIGAMLKQARVEAGITQEELAARLHTKKTAISRIENHAEDIKLSTIERFAEAIGKRLTLKIA
jgi:DNA-binding XRE family transcriptional regulator